MEEKQRSKESERLNATLMAGLEILDYLENHAQASLAELSRELTMNKSRLMRLCGTLEQLGYLIQRREDGCYVLGPRLLSLGRAFERYNPLIAIVRSQLKNLAAELNETVSFQVIRGTRRLCICSVECSHLSRYSTPEGGEASFPYGASSKVLLAWGPPELRQQVLAQAPYRRYTVCTPVTSEELTAAIELTRLQGYSISMEERTPETAAVAMPAFGRDGELLGAISVALLASQMEPAFLRHIVEEMKNTALALQSMVVHAPSFEPRRPRQDH